MEKRQDGPKQPSQEKLEAKSPFWVWAETRNWGSGDAQTIMSLTDPGSEPSDQYHEQAYDTGSTGGYPEKYFSEDGGKTWKQRIGGKDKRVGDSTSEALSGKCKKTLSNREQGIEDGLDLRSKKE